MSVPHSLNKLDTIRYRRGERIYTRMSKKTHETKHETSLAQTCDSTMNLSKLNRVTFMFLAHFSCKLHQNLLLILRKLCTLDRHGGNQNTEK